MKELSRAPGFLAISSGRFRKPGAFGLQPAGAEGHSSSPFTQWEPSRREACETGCRQAGQSLRAREGSNQMPLLTKLPMNIDNRFEHLRANGIFSHSSWNLCACV